MSGGDDDFRPRLGRIGNRSGGTKGSMRAFLKGARTNGNVTRRASPSSPRGFTGVRRAIIQARFVKLGGGGMGAQRAHLGYLQRDGAGKDQERAEFMMQSVRALLARTGSKTRRMTAIISGSSSQPKTGRSSTI